MDLGVVESCISSVVLKRIKVKVVEQDDFSYVEMAYGAKQKVGGKVKYFIIHLGEFIVSVNLFVTILGSYDIVIGMDWLESHDVILNCKKKRLSLIDDLGHSRVIIGRNQGVSLRFICSLQLQQNMCKGCKLYTILVLNEKCDMDILEYFPVVSYFANVFLEELSGLLPNK
jgi:hypothetical protein